MLDRIRVFVPSLAPPEQRLEQPVQGDPRSFALLPVSEFAEHRTPHTFLQLGVRTIVYRDGHMQLMSAAPLGPGDCVVAIATSGRTRGHSPMVSRLLHRLIIDIVATCVALRIGSEVVQPRLRDIKNKLRNKHYS